MARSLCLCASVVTAIVLGGLAVALAHPATPVGPGEPAGAGEHVLPARDDSVLRFTRIALIPMGDVRGVAAGGGLAYVTEAASGLHAYDMHDPSAPVELGRASTVGTASHVAIDGDIALVADGEGSVSLFDLSNPASLSHLSILRLGHPEVALAAHAGSGLVADGKDLALFDYTTPGTPREVGRIAMDYFGPRDIAVSGTLAYIALHWDRLRIVDIADPAHPTAHGSLGESGEATGLSVAVDGARAYVGERILGTYYIPTPVPPTPGPSPTGPTGTPTPAATPPPDGGRLTVVDVSDPDAPRAIGSSNAWFNRPIGVVRPDGDLIWTLGEPGADWWWPQLVDVSDPAHPALASVQFDEAPPAWHIHPNDLAIDGDVVYIGAREGLLVLRRVRGDSGTPTPSTTALARATPTPTTTLASPPTPATPSATATFETPLPLHIYLPVASR
jgi:hypothetical protein